MHLRPGVETKASLKRSVKALLANAPRRPHAPDTRILTYHSVGDRDHEMNVSTDAFRDQMAWLRDHRRVISLEEAARGEAGVALTFDDGYADNLNNAAPVLNEFEFPATVFVVAGRLGQRLDQDSARLLDEYELCELDAAGIEIGAHSMSHPRLAALAPGSKRSEILGCKLKLELILDRPVRSFAYPYGTQRDYDAASIAIVREAGFACAVSNRYGPNRTGADPFTLRRINIDATDTLETFTAKVDGGLDSLRLLESDLGLFARATLNRVLSTR